jgi:hypothetical protein
MPIEKSINYKGITIDVWEQTISFGGSSNLWLRRPVEDRDITAVKSIIDTARSGLADELRELQKQTDKLIAS